ncbi:MAG: radical SAM protein [Elusimicrobia bacterium]|nr:radical SAM protein [Elusimicrobiota bacterium]
MEVVKQKKYSDDLLRRIFALSDRDNFPEFPPNYPPPPAWENFKSDSTGRILKAWENSLKNFPEHEPVVYVHFPFCRTLCRFCGFYKKTAEKPEDIDAYLSGLKKEISILSPLFKNTDLRFLCVGGGTPSLMNCSRLDAFFKLLRSNFKITPDTRIAFESSPATLDEEKLKFLKKCGVEWLAVGVQSFDDELMREFNRVQNRRQTLEVLKAAQKVGIKQVEVDLMVGLPGQSDESFLKDVDIVSKLDVERVYIFDFQPKHYSAVEGSSKAGSLPAGKLEKARAARRKAMDILHSRGYLTSCGHWVYKREGHKWPYSYDQGEDGSYSILGLGPSAVSYAMGEARYQNVCSQTEYERRLSKGALPVQKGVFISEKDEMINFISLDALHRGQIDASAFKLRFAGDIKKIFKTELADMVKKNILIERENSFIVVNRQAAVFEIRKQFYSDEMIEKLKNKYQVTSHKSQVTSYKSQVTSHKSQAAGLKSQVIVNEPQTASPFPHPINRMNTVAYECRLTANCNLNCGFCSKGVAIQDKPLKLLAADIAEARKKSFKDIIFAGGEPCLSPHLGVLTGFAKKLGYKEIIVFTNGSVTSRPAYCADLKKHGMTGAVISIHSRIPGTHDSLVQGNNFMDTVKSLNNFLNLKIKVDIACLINKRNATQLAGFAEYFARFKVSGFIFIFPRYFGKMKADFSGERRLAVAYDSIKHEIKKLAMFAKKRKADVKFFNVPPCVLHPHAELAGDMPVEKQSVGDARESAWHGELIKPKPCLVCKYLLVCPGPVSDYIENFGLDEIKAIIK